MTCVCVSCDTVVCVPRLVDVCAMTHVRGYCSYTCIRDVTHLHVWHDEFTCVTYLIYMCGMPHFYVTVCTLTRGLVDGVDDMHGVGVCVYVCLCVYACCLCVC